MYPPPGCLSEKEQKKAKTGIQGPGSLLQSLTSGSDSLLHTNFAKSTIQICASEKFQATFRCS